MKPVRAAKSGGPTNLKSTDKKYFHLHWKLKCAGLAISKCANYWLFKASVHFFIN